MVFIGGPRQVGKTTLAQTFIPNFHDGHRAYLNWDNELHRQLILKGDWSKEEPVVIFDEIHKRKAWQSLIKGYWDTWKNTQKFVVTGSAKLNIFRKGGDSLLGRYYYFRIHPYTLPELGISSENARALFEFGGFPEPLLSRDSTELRRWHLQRIAKVVRVDLRSIENVVELDKIEVLAETLESRVGSLLSYKSLAEDLEVSDKTVKRWIEMLSNLYFSYLIYPFGAQKMKAIKKTPKLYLWDWSQIADPGAKFENMVASHLLKLCDYWQDVLGHRTELRFLRDQNGRECDFIVIKDKAPVFAVEAKLSQDKVSDSVLSWKNKIKGIPWYQVNLEGQKKIIAPDLKVLNFVDFCKELELV